MKDRHGKYGKVGHIAGDNYWTWVGHHVMLLYPEFFRSYEAAWAFVNNPITLK